MIIDRGGIFMLYLFGRMPYSAKLFFYNFRLPFNVLSDSVEFFDCSGIESILGKKFFGLDYFLTYALSYKTKNERTRICRRILLISLTYFKEHTDG